MRPGFDDYYDLRSSEFKKNRPQGLPKDWKGAFSDIDVIARMLVRSDAVVQEVLDLKEMAEEMDFAPAEYRGVEPLTLDLGILPNRNARFGLDGRRNIIDPTDPFYADNPDVDLSPASFSSPKNRDRSEIPTATSNPSRPRTIAAAYSRYTGADKDSGVLTIVFRDGTFYNYYDVTVDEWISFRGQTTKGPWIRDNLDSKRRGPADMSQVPEDIRREFYGRIRSLQLMHSPGFVRPARSAFKTKKKTDRKNLPGYTKIRKDFKKNVTKRGRKK